MAKVAPDLILDPTKLPDAEKSEGSAPKELPKPLADFHEHIKSKLCYHSKPLDNAVLLNVQPKLAYQCQIKILVETRKVHTESSPYYWTSETRLGSRTLGRFFEDTVRPGEEIGNIWTDYNVDIPSADKAKRVLALVESISYTRCSGCRGKGLVTCSCGGVWVNNRTEICSRCRGSGKVTCSGCRGLGGFRHVPKLTVKWHTRASTWFYQNSFLHPKRIRKGQKSIIWPANKVPWSKVSSMENYVQSLCDETPEIPLRENIIKDYYAQHLNPIKDKNNVMRRLELTIGRLEFLEVNYTMGENYVNKREPGLGKEHTFRFCQYPEKSGKLKIYENDYPLNCCGCFGPSVACYSSCCTIL